MRWKYFYSGPLIIIAITSTFEKYTALHCTAQDIHIQIYWSFLYWWPFQKNHFPSNQQCPTLMRLWFHDPGGRSKHHTFICSSLIGVLLFKPIRWPCHPRHYHWQVANVISILELLAPRGHFPCIQDGALYKIAMHLIEICCTVYSICLETHII